MTNGEKIAEPYVSKWLVVPVRCYLFIGEGVCIFHFNGQVLACGQQVV